MDAHAPAAPVGVMAAGGRRRDREAGPARDDRGASGGLHSSLPQLGILAVLAAAAVISVVAGLHLLRDYARPIGIGLLGGLALLGIAAGVKLILLMLLSAGLSGRGGGWQVIALPAPLIVAGAAGLMAALRALDRLGTVGWLWVALGAGAIVAVILPTLAILSAVTREPRKRVMRYLRDRRERRTAHPPAE